jgi:predicted tellurium resistance membrane protein TerC
MMVKMLALSFLLLIGMTLLAEGWGPTYSKGLHLFRDAFSVFVEMLNLRAKKAKGSPVKFHQPYIET